MVQDVADRNNGRNRRNQNQTEGSRPSAQPVNQGSNPADRRKANQSQGPALTSNGKGRTSMPHSSSQNSIQNPNQSSKYGSSYSLVDGPVSTSGSNRPSQAPASAPGGMSTPPNQIPPFKHQYSSNSNASSQPSSLEVKPQPQGQVFETFGEMGFSSSKVQKDKDCLIM